VDNQRLKYKLGEVNAFRADCIISKENLNDKLECVYTRDYESGELYNKGIQKRHKYSAPKVEKTVEANEHKELKKRKGTGGKKLYTKVYAGDLLKLKRDEVSLEMMGFCTFLTPFVEWETGWLVCGYGKKKEFMTQRDIAKELRLGIATVNRVISKLRALGIVVYDGTKYKLSTKFFAKGMVTNEDKV